MIRATTSGSLTIVASRGERMEGCSYRLARIGGCGNPYVLDGRWKEHEAEDGAEGRSSKSNNSRSRMSHNNNNGCGVSFFQSNSGSSGCSNNLVKVASVGNRSPFSKTGLKAGDVVLTVDGKVVATSEEAENVLAGPSHGGGEKSGGDEKGRAVALLVYSFWDMRYRVLREKLPLEHPDDNAVKSGSGGCSAGNNNNNNNNNGGGGYGEQSWQVSWSYDRRRHRNNAAGEAGDNDEHGNDNNNNNNNEYVILKIPNTTVTFQLDFDPDGTCSCGEPYKALDSIPPEELREREKRTDGDDGGDDDEAGGGSDSKSVKSHLSIDEARAALELLFRTHIQPAIDALNFRTWKQVRLLAEALRVASEAEKIRATNDDRAMEDNNEATARRDGEARKGEVRKNNGTVAEGKEVTQHDADIHEGEKNFGKSEVTEVDYFSLAPDEPEQAKGEQQPGRKSKSPQPHTNRPGETSDPEPTVEDNQSFGTPSFSATSRRSVEPPGEKSVRAKSRSPEPCEAAYNEPSQAAEEKQQIIPKYRSPQPHVAAHVEPLQAAEAEQNIPKFRSPQPYAAANNDPSQAAEEEKKRTSLNPSEEPQLKTKSKSPHPHQSASATAFSKPSSEEPQQTRRKSRSPQPYQTTGETTSEEYQRRRARSPQPYQSAAVASRRSNDRSPQPYQSTADVSETVQDKQQQRRSSVQSTFEERQRRRASERSQQKGINPAASSDKSGSTGKKTGKGLEPKEAGDDFQAQLGKLDLSARRGSTQQITPPKRMYNPTRNDLKKSASERVPYPSRGKTSSMIPIVNGEAVNNNSSNQLLNNDDANNIKNGNIDNKNFDATNSQNRRPGNRLRRRPSVIPAHFNQRSSQRVSELTAFGSEDEEEDQSSVGSGTSTTSSDDSKSSSDSEGSTSSGEETFRKPQQKKPQQRQRPTISRHQSQRKRQEVHSKPRLHRRNSQPRLAKPQAQHPQAPPKTSSQLVLYNPDDAAKEGYNARDTEQQQPSKPKPLPRRLKMRNGDIRQRYKVSQQIIGTGAFGTVRSCVNRKTQEKLAVKSILKKGNVKNAILLKNEIALVQRIKHRNVVCVVDVVQDAEYIHIVMEECRGGDLFDKIVDGGVRLDEKRACEIIGSLVDALAYLHDRNIVHRDLKAEHIMLSNNDVNTSPVKIIDFGLAIIHDSSVDPPMTAFAGSAFSVAPEVIKRKYGIECDMWSAGVITYFLLTQKMPFNSQGDKEIFDKICAGSYTYPQWTQTGLSEEAKDFIDRLLVVDPKRRLTAKQALNHVWIRKHNQERLGNSINSEELALVPAPEMAIVPAKPSARPRPARMSRDPSVRGDMKIQQQQRPRQQQQRQSRRPEARDGRVSATPGTPGTARRTPRRSLNPNGPRNDTATRARPSSSRRSQNEPVRPASTRRLHREPVRSASTRRLL